VNAICQNWRTIVTMLRQLPAGLWTERLLGAIGVLAALAAIAVPGPSSELTEIAALMCIASLALTAGHSFAGPAMAAAAVVLGGHLLPIVIEAQTIYPQAGVVALFATLPGAALFLTLLPRAVEPIFARQPVRQAGAFLGGVGYAALLVVPILLVF
jgi:hypothetical protein